MYVVIEGKNNITKTRLSNALIRCGAVICHSSLSYNGLNIKNRFTNIIIVLDNESVNACRRFIENSDINQFDIVNLSDVSVAIDRGREHCLSKEILRQEQGLKSLATFISRIYYQYHYPASLNKLVKLNNELMKSAAASSASILIQGETGTGKERAAKFIHYNSPFVDGSYVAVNCAAIPNSMMEATLFGYEKGAFTSAVNQHVGKFEKANNGSILLDEIGEMSLDMQTKLLRVLEEQEIERLGGNQIIPLQFRTISSTNKDLNKQVELGKFRSDLLYRLNVITINCIPLRDRLNDLTHIAEYLYHYYMQLMGRESLAVNNHVYDLLLQYNWPGNIRELENKIYRSIIVSSSNEIKRSDFEFISLTAKQDDDIKDLKSQEAEIIYKALLESNGSRTLVAKKLNINPRTLRNKISKMKNTGIEIP